MRTFNAQIAADLEAGRVVKRELVEFQLGGGTLRYVKDDEPRQWNSETWHPGAFLSVSEINRESGLSASTFTVQLSASEDDALTPAELKTYYTYDWNDRKVVIRDLFLDPDTGEIITAEPLIQGYVDRVRWMQTRDEGALIAIDCADRSMDFFRKNDRMANDADQRLRNADDKFFEHAATIGQQNFWWGRKN